MTEEWYGYLDQSPEAIEKRNAEFEAMLRETLPELRCTAEFVLPGDEMNIGTAKAADKRETILSVRRIGNAVHINGTSGYRTLLHYTVPVSIWKRGDAENPEPRNRDLQSWITYMQERNDP